MSSDRVCTALRAKLPASEYALFFEVRDAAGFAANRSCDAMALSLWPSRGIELLGFEVKVSRGDWLRELKNPAKAEAIAKYCDRWIIVATEGVIVNGELPPLWGLWELLDSGKWRTAVTPPKLAPEPMNKSFIAAMLRRASEANERIVEALIAKERAEERTKFEERVKQHAEHRVQQSTRDHAELRRRVDEFEKAAGIKIDDWRAGDVGRAVKIVLEQGNGQIMVEAMRLRDRLDALLETVNSAAGKARG